MAKVKFLKQSFILATMNSVTLLVLKLLSVSLIFPYRNFYKTVVVPLNL